MFNLTVVMNNLMNTAILFFFLGIISKFIHSDLMIPNPVSKFISYYLLFSIGIKGGAEIAHSGLHAEMLTVLLIAILMSFFVPFYTFFILRKKMNVADSAAISATYGSISAVTFVTAINFLQNLEVEFGGYMVAAMALMEAPAIISGLILYNMYGSNESVENEDKSLLPVLNEAFTNGSVVLITGSLLIGLVATPSSVEAMKPFTHDLFKGFLAFFLLDMGQLAASRIRALRKTGIMPFAFSIFVPLFNGMIAIFLSYLTNLSQGNAFLLTVLCASASYIAVPAAMRVAIPKANAGLYVPMSLALTFPFNIVIGLPLYYFIITLIIQ